MAYLISLLAAGPISTVLLTGAASMGGLTLMEEATSSSFKNLDVTCPMLCSADAWKRG